MLQHQRNVFPRSELHSVAVCYILLQCVAVCCSMKVALMYVAASEEHSHALAVSCNVLQCVAMCCNVLQLHLCCGIGAALTFPRSELQ